MRVLGGESEIKKMFLLTAPSLMLSAGGGGSGGSGGGVKCL